MKYLQQFLIIMAVTCAGELLRYFLPLPIPASIYGLVLMLVLLLCDVVKVESVRESGQFLIAIMPVMFIPAAVGLINTWGELKPILAGMLITILASTVIVMAVTGKCAEFIMKRSGGKK